MTAFDHDRAQRLLKHYLSRGFEASGLKWDIDNDAEVEAIVDSLRNDFDRRLERMERLVAYLMHRATNESNRLPRKPAALYADLKLEIGYDPVES